ncbi:Calcium/calmodulin-dependent protein kinase type 1 [Podochytrium sp. JEL0797]|nr:Calcium/calmodulin-dependent protein kinase type 1 [Podochytrium sp. JEL0797]
MTLTKSIQSSTGEYATTATDTLPNLHCFNPRSHFEINIEFSSGSADLWAWSYFERCVAWSNNATVETPKLPIKVIQRIAYETLLAMAHLHDRLHIFHADIKIENLLVSVLENQEGAAQDDYAVSVRVCDFGHSNWLNQGMKHIGTLGNASPELVRASQNKGLVDGAKADVFALGKTIQKLLEVSGIADCDGYEEELEMVNDLLEGMLWKDPKDRYSMREAAGHAWFK